MSLLDWPGFEQPIAARGGVAGRAATEPRILASLWLLALTENLGSGRRLEQRRQSHAVYQWICGGMSVNYHSLNDFRTGHLSALDELFTQVLGRLMHLGIVSLQSITQDRFAAREDDSEAVAAWRERMKKSEAQAIYQQRYAAAETVNADLKCWRGLGRLLVNGTQKVLAAALWSALAYNLMHFGAALIG